MNWIDKLNYFIILSWFRFISILPLKILYLLSELITFLVYRVFGYRKKVVLQNLRNSFPEKSEIEIKHIAGKFYRHLSVLIVENMYLRFVSDKRIASMIEVENIEMFEQYYKQQKNLVVMLGHYGNWEFGGGLLQFVNYKGAPVYKKLSSKVFDKIYFDIRSRFDCEPVEMHDVFRKVITLNQSNKPFILFMVADQSPMKSDQQHWLTFLNQTTGVYLGSEKLAKKFDMPVVYMELKRIKKGAYRIIPTLITDKPKECKANEITEKYYELLEKSIQRSPRYWLWSHRRWKHLPNE